MWWWIWAIGVLALLVGGFFLLRRVYRSARALGSELTRAGEQAARFGTQFAELTADPPASVGPTMWDDPTELRGRVAAAVARRGARREARIARNRSVWTKWRNFNR